MKFGKTGRNNTDKNKFMENKPRGSFLERFKGRTIQMNKEGHLGVVHNTKIPIKPVHDQPYNNNQQYEHHSALVKNYGNGTDRQNGTKSNFEILSPMKRSNSDNEDTFATRNDRYNSFARNYKKAENMLSHSHNNTSSLRKGLSKAGDNVLRVSHGNSRSGSLPKMGSSHSMGTVKLEKNQPLIRTSFNQKQNQVNPYSSMKAPLAMAASLKGGNSPAGTSVQKSSFYSAQNSSTSLMTNNKGNKSNGYPMPYSGNGFGGGNSDGFINTAVSTPLYKKVKKYGSQK